MKTLKDLTILYIESDDRYREENAQMMRKLGLNVLEAGSIGETNELFRHHTINIILIDLDLHQKERMTFIRFLRYKEIVAPIIITADNSDKDILLDAISLDTTRYLIKPLKKDELLNALKVAFTKSLAPLPAILIDNDLGMDFTYDPINKSIHTLDDADVQLTKKEYLLLELLIKHKKQIVTYDEIEREVWQDSSMSSGALRALIHAIRDKTYPAIISTHNGIGYKLNI
ncbi:MAG: winged helix-turn-helix domain-containing protein [Sulfuricurvum sp.]